MVSTRMQIVPENIVVFPNMAQFFIFFSLFLALFYFKKLVLKTDFTSTSKSISNYSAKLIDNEMRTTKRENKYSLVNLLIYLFIYKFAK